MKQIPESLLREINRAHKKSDKLRRKLGYTGLRSRKLTKDDIYEIEVKVSPEEYEKLNGRLPELEEIDFTDRQWAYFYNRKETTLFTAEKILNGELKEYYAEISTVHSHLENEMHIFSGYGPWLVNMLDYQMSMSTLLTGFNINGVPFYPNYVSVDPATNKPDQAYFYAPSEKLTNFFVRNQTGQSEIVRVSLADYKVSQIYTMRKIDEDHCAFAYYKPDNLVKPYVYLISIH